MFCTPYELAARWRISANAIYNCKAGTDKLTRFYFGRTLRFKVSEILAEEARLAKKGQSFKKSN